LHWRGRQPNDRLSRKHREVLDLVYYHGKSVKEVAQIVGIDEATLKMRMYDAHRRFGGVG
jgi:RNA polymerase sigma-70 factor (ECF subfamily)